jgi:diguanylate cyclase (GGDEF)-like protein
VQAPPIPIDETRRLQALTTLCILDTLPEERFDRITRLAARALGVPIALVSLVDRDRQWFKSKQGLEACETSRHASFCGHAILEEGALIIEDALLDGRFADNPLVRSEPHIRFYAGHPIHGPDGSRVGTLCVIDRRPRTFLDEDKAVLADLAGMVDRELALIENATTDELTSLSNRRGFAQVALHVLALCRRNQLGAAVVAIDLDNFKSVNDNHGHDAGDEALCAFSRLLFRSFRDSDVVARMGGDEFAVLCSGTTGDRLGGALERLRADFAGSTLASRYPQLSWSAGVADFNPGSKLTIDELLQVADARMYATKVSRKRSRGAASSAGG